ncbi:MAG: rod shape-determining protein MreC [bacterium]
MQQSSFLRRDGTIVRNKRRLSVVFFLAISIFMILFSLYGAQASVFEKAREAVVDIAEPVLEILSAPVKMINKRIGNISDYLNVLEQNEQLRQENDELREWMNEALLLRRKVAYFESVLNMHSTSQTDVIDAKVVGETGGPYQRSMILNVGRNDGVQPGDAVIDAEGLIGHVVTVGSRASRILLLTDFASRTPVFVEGANIEAILAGRYSEMPELKFLAVRDRQSLNVGQRLITAGTDGILPRGLPVGEIAEVTDKTITIKLYSDYSATDLVRVVNYQFTMGSPQDISPETDPNEDPVETVTTDG